MLLIRLTALTAFVLLPIAAQAQIGFKQNALGRTIAISGLTSADDDVGCGHADFSGRVVHREFEPNAVTLKAFVIEHRDGTRDYINVSVPDEIDEATRRAVYPGLQRLTKVGRVVSGKVIVCGSGEIETLSAIK